jgi:hypothetical protein
VPNDCFISEEQVNARKEEQRKLVGRFFCNPKQNYKERKYLSENTRDLVISTTYVLQAKTTCPCPTLRISFLIALP